MTTEADNPYEEGDYPIDPEKTKAFFKAIDIPVDWVERLAVLNVIDRMLSESHNTIEMTGTDEPAKWLLALAKNQILKLDGKEL